MAAIRAVVNIGQGRAEIRDVPYPTLPGDEYILVKATAWALNPDDAYKLHLPEEQSCAEAIIGGDFTGYVLEIGNKVAKTLRKGDRVAGMVLGQNILRKADGAFAEVVAIKGDIVTKVPDTFSDAEAATQGVSIATMAQALYRGLGLPLPGEETKQPFTLFINGGGSSMGMAAVQFAKLSGGLVIATASPANKQYLESLGADYVFDYNSPTLVEDVRTAAGGSPHLAFDAYPSAESPRISAEVLSGDSGAQYVTLNPGVEDKVKALDPSIKATSVLAYSVAGDPYWFEGEYFESKPADLELQKSFIPVAEKLIAEGQLKAPRVILNHGGQGLNGIPSGLKELKAKQVRGGKLVYTLEE